MSNSVKYTPQNEHFLFERFLEGMLHHSKNKFYYPKKKSTMVQSEPIMYKPIIARILISKQWDNIYDSLPESEK